MKIFSALRGNPVEAEQAPEADHSEPEGTSTSAQDELDSCGTIGGLSLIRKGGTDCRGEHIDEVYFKRANYAIYQSGPHVVIQNSDDEKIAKEQIDLVSQLIPLRDKLTFLLSGRDFPGCYRRHIADAFRLTLEGKQAVGVEILNGSINEVLDYKARIGRSTYLVFAGPLALGVCITLLVSGVLAFNEGAPAVARLLLAASGGAMGALLSIAIALRTRTVAVDDDKRANWLDGLIRVLIGTVSGGVLMLVLVTGVVASISMTMVKDGSADLAWQAALIVGFAAGFFERLVPDLLAQSFNAQPKVTSSPAVSEAPAST